MTAELPPAGFIARSGDARVRVVHLASREESPWHRHTDLFEHVVALSPGLWLEQAEPQVRTELCPGAVVGVDARRPHRLVNAGSTPAAYLLIQKGTYDFVEVSPAGEAPTS